MKFNSIFSVLAASLLIFFVSNTAVSAQSLFQNNPQICLACAPSLSNLTATPNPNPNQCKSFTLTVNSGMSGRCSRVGYNWTTNDPGATINFFAGNALIEFSGTGTFEVCVTFTVGFDRNGDGTIGADEQCTVEDCINVVVTDPC